MMVYLIVGASLVLLGLMRMSAKECAQIRNAAHMHGDAAVYVAVGCLLLIWPVIVPSILKTATGRS